MSGSGPSCSLRDRPAWALRALEKNCAALVAAAVVAGSGTPASVAAAVVGTSIGGPGGRAVATGSSADPRGVGTVRVLLAAGSWRAGRGCPLGSPIPIPEGDPEEEAARPALAAAERFGQAFAWALVARCSRRCALCDSRICRAAVNPLPSPLRAETSQVMGSGSSSEGPESSSESSGICQPSFLVHSARSHLWVGPGKPCLPRL